MHVDRMSPASWIGFRHQYLLSEQAGCIIEMPQLYGAHGRSSKSTYTLYLGATRSRPRLAGPLVKMSSYFGANFFWRDCAQANLIFHIAFSREVGQFPAMSLDWTISHIERLVALTAADVLNFEELEAYLSALDAEHALTYRKLFDARAGRTHLTDREIGVYHERIFHLARLDPFGPLALVVGHDRGVLHEPLIRLLLVIHKREIRVFSELDEATDWIRVQPLPPPRSDYLNHEWRNPR